MYDTLSREGYTILMFDRYGVGFSDQNILQIPPTVNDFVDEMELIMSSVLPIHTRW
jgi:pimeloyl-ACP methyl ester carboxylesterase